MPPRRRRPLRALPDNEVGGAAVENALILSLTTRMIYAFKTTNDLMTLIKPLQQTFATLIKALS